MSQVISTSYKQDQKYLMVQMTLRLSIYPRLPKLPKPGTEVANSPMVICMTETMPDSSLCPGIIHIVASLSLYHELPNNDTETYD